MRIVRAGMRSNRGAFQRTVRSRKQPRGVSMIEVSIAMLVIALALLGTLGLILQSSNLNLETRDQSTAQEIAATEIERLRGFTEANQFDQLAALDGSSQPVDELNQGTMTRSVDTSNPNLYWIRVRVTWEAQNRPHEYELSAMVSR